MKAMHSSRHALSITAVALLAACNGSQIPIGAPGVKPQTHAIATHADRTVSRMLDTSRKNLIYAVGGCDGVCVVAYPKGAFVGSLANDGAAICSDERGNVFITSDSTVTEYKHGGTHPIETFNLPGTQAAGCAVDPLTNNLAVVYSASGANVAIFPNESGPPALYAAPIDSYYCGYDNSGNLFVDGTSGSNYALAELANGAENFSSISVDQSVGFPGQIQWDGQYMTYEGVDPGDIKFSRLSIKGSAATIVGTTYPRLRGTAGASWFFRSRIIIPHSGHHIHAKHNFVISYFPYPRGGPPVRGIKDFGTFKKIDMNFIGVTVSVPPGR